MLHDSLAAKKEVAKKALSLIEDGFVVGVGTGSTVEQFIPLLARMKDSIKGCVASSSRTLSHLEKHKLNIMQLTETEVDIYVDGADNIDKYGNLLKGLGGALLHEKVLAGAASKFICIADKTKYSEVLHGTIPVEVIPMARGVVAKKLLGLGQVVLREGFITDNGNIILDIKNVIVKKPQELEAWLNNIPGVIENGIFSAIKPSEIILSS